MFSVVMGGAPGGASRNTSSPSRTRRALRGGCCAGWRRAVRKRTSSSSACCSGGSASAAASISVRVLMGRVYHRQIFGANQKRNGLPFKFRNCESRKQKSCGENRKHISSFSLYPLAG